MMLKFMKKIAIHFENHTKRTTSTSENAEYFMLKKKAYTEPPRLKD